MGAVPIPHLILQNSDGRDIGIGETPDVAPAEPLIDALREARSVFKGQTMWVYQIFFTTP
jgi:hypothetical protein